MTSCSFRCSVIGCHAVRGHAACPARIAVFRPESARLCVVLPCRQRQRVMNSTTMLSSEQRDAFNVLLGVARDLTSSLASSDRYSRLLDAVRRVIPCDAACLLRVDGPYLTPVAGFGLSSSALSRRYDRREQPRLDVILRSSEPVRFPADSPLAD